MLPTSSIITKARSEFHAQLISSGTLTIEDSSKGRIASNADKSQKASRELALHIAEQLHAKTGAKNSGQKAGAGFERAVRDFVQATFPYMQAVRPGNWVVENVGSSRRKDHLEEYEPYTHLADLAEAVRLTPQLGAALGNSYMISPDVLVLREAVSDEELNSSFPIVDSDSALLSPLRASNRDSTRKFVHAVISCKWTMRSDRSQNTRAEALNLLRNRKGRAPHILAVTAEPSLSRIASLALGTGDIDMVYHIALPELVSAVSRLGSDEAKDLLSTLVDGNRLRDIGDLPLDLSI